MGLLYLRLVGLGSWWSKEVCEPTVKIMIGAGKIEDNKERVVRRFSQVQFDRRAWVSSYASAISCQSLNRVQTHHLPLSFSLTFIVPCLNVNYIFHICYTVLPGSLTACAELTTVTFPRYYRLASSFLPSWLWDTGTQTVQVWANYSQTHAEAISVSHYSAVMTRQEMWK